MAASKIKYNQAFVLQGSGNSGALDIQDGAGTIDLGYNVSAFAGTTPSITFGVDMMGPDGVWYNVYTSSAITVAGNALVTIGKLAASVTALGTTIRVTWAIGGTATPKASFTAFVMYP